MQTAWIIAIGSELTLGRSLDTNTAWLAERLAALGIRTTRHVTVPDDLDATREAVLQAAEAADIVLITGGLGPTDDDLTRAALAAAANAPLELHPPSLEHLRAYFAARNRVMPERNVVQAHVPRGAAVLPNTCGTAPGLRVTLRGKPCYALPGVPFEMRAMFDSAVAPELRGRTIRAVVLFRTLHTFGLGESDVGQRLADLMVRGRNPEIGTTADLGIIGVRIYAAADSPREAEALLDRDEAEIRRRLGEIVYGRDGDTLAGVVGRLLVASGRTLSTAESCTGGLVGMLITDVPGSSRYYRGGVIAYANEAKIAMLGVLPATLAAHGAVSREIACELAAGAARAFATDYAVSLTGVAGPSGGTSDKPVGLVFIGVRTPHRLDAYEFRFGPDAPRDAVRSRAARTALNLLRLRLDGR